MTTAIRSLLNRAMLPRVRRPYSKMYTPLRRIQGHHLCPVCNERMVPIRAPRCFRCGHQDEVFKLLDKLIAEGISTPRARLEDQYL